MMNSNSARDQASRETSSSAMKYRKFLKELYERFKHDNGQDLSEWSEVEAPAVFDIIRFRSKDELKYYDPNTPEFWSRKSVDRPRHAKVADETSYDFPDPLSDDEFKRIQGQVCAERRHNDLLEQSIQRCELPEEELEKQAEDVPSIEDLDDFKKEIESLRRAFKSYCEGDSDITAEEDSADEIESAQRLEDTRNILECLNRSENDETKVEEIDISRIRDFRPRKSSTFLEPNPDFSQEDAVGHGEYLRDSPAANSDCTKDVNDTTRLCATANDDSTLLVIRVTCEESDSSTAGDSDSLTSASSTPPTQKKSGLKKASANKSRTSIGSANHPPLHTLTPLQRRLVKLNLY